MAELERLCCLKRTGVRLLFCMRFFCSLV